MTRYTRKYPGDSDDKRQARLFLYKHAAEGSRAGHAITLAGTEPFAEVSLLRDYLQWPAAKTWFVDWAKQQDNREEVLEALALIKRNWPAANVIKDDINNVVAGLSAIGFANLDFMGLMERKYMQPCIQAVIARLVPGGTLGLTWFRGREIDAPYHSGWDVHEAARDVQDIGERRWVGVVRMVEGWASQSGVRLSAVGGLEYQHRHSPMSVTVWRRT